MVRETRYLLVRNLPENCTEQTVIEHFQRYGKIQSVKLQPSKDNDTDSTATVAFNDIKSAAKAHHAKNSIGEVTLRTDYWEGSTGTPVLAGTPVVGNSSVRSAVYTSATPASSRLASTFSTWTKGPSEDDGSSTHDKGDSNQASLPGNISSIAASPALDKLSSTAFDLQRGRGRDRIKQKKFGQKFEKCGGSFGRHGTTTSTRSLEAARSQSEAAAAAAAAVASSSAATPGQAAGASSGSTINNGSTAGLNPIIVSDTKEVRDLKESNRESSSRSRPHSVASPSSRNSGVKKSNSHSRSVSRSRSRSRGSRSSSRSSRSSGTSQSTSPHRSHTSSTARPQSMVGSSRLVSSEVKEAKRDNEERRPLGICVMGLPIRSTDSSLRDGLYHEYKKQGKVTTVQICGDGDNRCAIISFRKPEDAAKALEASQGKKFFGAQIKVVSHEGVEVDDADRGNDIDSLDEYHVKSTRTLFVGNLEKETTTQDLIDKFKQFGDIIDVDIKRQGATTAFGFVQYADIVSVVKALREMEGEHIGSNKIKLGFGKSMPTDCVWLDCLPSNTSTRLLRSTLDSYGEGVIYSYVDRLRNKGLVYFSSHEDAQRCVSDIKARPHFMKKKLQIDFASRECQNDFFERMERTNQLRANERPDDTNRVHRFRQQRSFDSFPEDGSPSTYGFSRTSSSFSTRNGRSSSGSTSFRRGRQYPDASFPEENHTSSTRRSRRQEEYGQSGQFYNSKGSTDDYDAVLREYGHSQRERRERDLSPRHSADRHGDSQSRQSSRDQSLDRYEKERTVEIYNSRDTSPGSDHNSFHSESRYRSSRDEKYTSRDRYDDAKVDKKDFDHHSRVSRNASPFVHNHSSSRSHDSDYEHRGGSRSQSPPTPIQEDSSVHRMYYNDEYKRSVEITDDYASYSHSQKQKDSDDAITKSKLVSIHPSKLGAEVLKTASKSHKRILEESAILDVSKLDGKLLRKSDKSSLLSTDKGKMSDKEKKHHEASRQVSKVHDQTGSPGSSGSHGDSENGSVSEGDLHHLHQEKHHILRKLQELNEEGIGTSEPDSPRSVSKIKSVAVKEALKLSGRSHEDRKLDEVGAKSDAHRRQGAKARAADSRRESRSHLTEEMNSTREDKNLIDEKEESIGGNSDLDYSSDLKRMKKRRTESSVDIASVKGKGYRRPSSVDISDEDDSDRKSDHGLRLLSASVVTRVSCDSRVGSKSYGDPSKTAEVSSCDSDVFKGGLSDKDISVIKQSQTVSKSNTYFPNKDWNVDYSGTVRSPVGCFSPACSDDHTQDSVTSGSFTEKSSEHLSSSSWQHAPPLPHLDKDISYGEYGYFKDFTIPGNISPDDCLSDDSLEGELLPAPGEPSVEERIRVIDEMLNMTSSNKSSDSSLLMSVLSNKDIANNNDNTALYSKFRIRKREGGLDGGNGSLLIDRKPEPSVIMQQVLSKKSILDQDFKRLEQMSEKYDLYSGREFLKTEVASPKLVEPKGDGYFKPLLSPSLLISPSLLHPVTTSSSMLQPTVTTSVAGSTSSFSVTSSSVLTTSVVSAPITTCSIHTLPKLAALDASKRLKVKPSEASIEVSDKHSVCTNVLMLKQDIVVSSSPSPSPSSSFPVLTFTNNSLTSSMSQSVTNSLVGTLTATETTTSQQSCKFAVSPSPLPPSLLSSSASSTSNSCVSSTVHPRTTLQHSVLMSPYITSLSSSSSLSVTQSTSGGAPVAAPFTQGPDKAQLTPIVGQEAPRLCSPSFTPENSRTTVSFHLPGSRSPRVASHAADNDELQKTNSKTDLKVIVSSDGDSKTDELKANTGISPDIESPVSVQSETSSIASVPLSSIDSKSNLHLDEKTLTIPPVIVSQCIGSQHTSDVNFPAKNSDSVKTELVSPVLDVEKTVAELCEKNQQNLHDNVILFETIKAADILVSREIKPSLPLTSHTVLSVSGKDHSEKQHSVSDISNSNSSKGKLCSASTLHTTDIDTTTSALKSSAAAPSTSHLVSKSSLDKIDKKVSGKLNSNPSKMAGASVKSEALFAPDVKMEQIVKTSDSKPDPRHHPAKGGASSKSSSSDRKSTKAPPKDSHDIKELQGKESDKAEKRLDGEHKNSSLHESTSKSRETHKGKDKRDQSKDSDKGRPKDKEDKKKEERKTSEKKPEKKSVTTKDDKKGEKKVDDRKYKNSEKTKVAAKSSQAKHSKVESNGSKQDKKQKEKVKDVKDKSGDKKVTTGLSSVSAKAQSTHEVKPDSKSAQRTDSTESKSTKHDAVKDSSVKSQKEGAQKSEANVKNEQKTKHKSDVKGASKGLSEAKSDSKESLTSTPAAKKPPQVAKPKKEQDKGGSKQGFGKQGDKFLKLKQVEDEKLKEKQKIKEEKERQKDKEKEEKELKEQEEKEKQKEKEEKERIEREEREKKEKEEKLKEERERQKEIEREEMEREQLKVKEEKEQKEREREERERQKEKEEKEKEKEERERQKEKEKEERERQKEKEKEEKEKQKEKEREERERHREKEKEEKQRQKEKEKEEKERQKEKEREEKERQKEKEREEKERQKKEREERERQKEKEKEEKERQKQEREEKERQKEKEREEKERQKEKEREEKERQKEKEREEKERQKEKEREEKERQKEKEREEKERQKEKEREEKERQKEKEKEEKERQKQEREERERQMEKEREEKERQKEKEQKERQKEKEEKERKDREEKEKMKKEKEEKLKQKEKDEKEILKEKEKIDRKLKNKEEQKDKIKKEKMKDMKPDKKGKEKKVKEDKLKKGKEDKFRKEKDDKNKKDKEEKEKANRDKEKAEKERKEKEEKEKKNLAPKKPKRNELAALLEQNDIFQMSYTSMYDRVKTQRNREPDPQHKAEPAPKSSFDKFKQNRKKNGSKAKSSFYTFDTSSDGSEDDGNADDDDDLSDLSDHDSNLKNEPVMETKPKKPKQIKKRAHVSSSSSSCEEDDDALLSATKPKSQKTDKFNAIFSSDSDDDNFQPPSKLKSSAKVKSKPIAKRRKTRDDSSDSLASRDDFVKPLIMSSITDSLDDMDVSDEDEIKSKRKKTKAKPILSSDHDDRDSSMESVTRKAAKTDLDSSLESLPKTAVKADKEVSPPKKTKPESKKVTKAHDSKVINKEGSKLHVSDKKKKKGEPEKGVNKTEPSSKTETGKQKPKVQSESKSVEKRKRKMESEKGSMTKVKATTKSNVQTPKHKVGSVSTAEPHKPRPNHDKANEEDKSRSKEDKPRPKEDKLKEEDKSRPKDDKIKEEDKSRPKDDKIKEEDKSRPKDDKIKEEDKSKSKDDKSKEEDKSRSKDDKQREEDKSKTKDDKQREEDKSKAKDDKEKEEDKSRPKDDKQREDKHRLKNDKPKEEDKTKSNVEPEIKSAAEKVNIESESKPHVGEPRLQPEAEAKSDREHSRAKSEEKQKVEVERTLHQEKNTAKMELDNKLETEVLKMEVESSSDTETAKSKVEYRHKSVEKRIRSKPGLQTKQDDERPVSFVEVEVKSDDDDLRGARSESDDKSTSKMAPSNDPKSKLQAERKKKNEDKEDSAVKKKKKKKYDTLKEEELVDSLITKVYDKFERKKEEKRKSRLSIFDSEPEDSSALSESSGKTVSSYAEKLSAKTEEVEPTKPKEDKMDSLKESARSENPADAKPAADEASKVAKKKTKKKKDKKDQKEIADEIGDVMMKDQLEKDKEKPDSETKQEKMIRSEDRSDDEHVRPPRKKRKKEHDRDTDQEKEHDRDTDREKEKGVKVGRSPEKKSDADKSMCFGNEDNANISDDKSSSQFVDEFTSFWGHPKPILIPKRLKDSKKSDDEKVKHKDHKDELKTGGNVDHSEASGAKDDPGDGREAKFSPSDDKTSEAFQNVGHMSDSDSTKTPKLELENIDDLIVPISEAETTVVTEVASVSTVDSVSSIGASLLMQEESVSGESAVVPDETTIGSSVEIDDDDFPSLIIDEVPESSEKKVTKKDKKLLKKQQVKEINDHMDEVIASVAMALSSDDEDETSLHIDSIGNDQELLLSDVINQELKYDKKISGNPETKTSVITDMLFANKEVKSRQLNSAASHGNLQTDTDASVGSGVTKKEQEKKEVVKNFGQLDEETKKRDEELLKTLAVLCDPNLDRPVVIDDSKREPTPEDIKKKEEADKKKAEEERIKLEEEKKKAEEEEQRKVEEEKKRVAEQAKKAAEEKEKAEAERKKAEEEEARRKIEEEKHRVEEEKRKAEEEKKRAEEEKQRAEEEKQRAEEEKKRAEEEKKRAEEEKKRAEEEEKRRVEEEEKRKAEEEKTRREKEEQALREASDEAARAVESLLEFQSGFDQEPDDVDDDLPPLFIEPADKEPPAETVTMSPTADKEPPAETITMSPTADKNDLVSIFSSPIPDKVTANLDDQLLEKKLEEKGSMDQADGKLDSFGLFATPAQTVAPAPVLTSPRRNSAGIKEKTPEPVTSPHRPMLPSPQMHSPHRMQFPPQRPLQSPQSQMQSPPNQMQSPPNQMQSPPNQMQSPQSQIQSPQNQIQSPQKASMSPQMDIHSPQPILHPQRSTFFSKDAKADRNFVLNTDVPPHSHVDILHGQQPQRRVSTTLSTQPILDQPLRPVQVSPRRKSQEFPPEQLAVSSRRNTITGPEDVSVTHLDRRFPPYMGSDIIFSKERTHSISSLPPPVSISLDHAPHDTNSQSPMQSLNIPSHQDNILLSPKKTSPVLQFKERTPDPPIFPSVANKSTLQEPPSHFSKGLIQEQIFTQYTKCPPQEQLFYSPKSQSSELFRSNKVAADNALLHTKSPATEKQTNLQPNRGSDSLLMPLKSAGQDLVLQHAKGPHHVLDPFPQHEKGLLPREQMFSPKNQPDNPFNYPDQNIDFLLNSPPRNNLTFPSFPQTTEVNLPPVAKQPDYSQDPLFIAAAEAGTRPGDREPSHIRRTEGFPASFYQEPVPSAKTHQDKVTISLQQHQSSVEDDKKGTRKRKRNSKKTTNEDRAAALAEQQAIEESVQANVDSIRKALTAHQAKAAAEKAHMGGSDKKKSLDAYDFEAHIGQDIISTPGVLASDGGYSSFGETEAKPLRSRNERGRGRGYGGRRGRRGRGAISSVHESAETQQRPDSLPSSQPPLNFPVHAQNADSVQVQQHPLQQFALSQQQLPSFQRQAQQSQSNHQSAHAYSQSHPSPVSSENSSSLPGPDWHQKPVSQPYPHSHVAPAHQQTLQQPSVRLPLPKSDVLSSESNKQDLDLSYGESELIINLDDQPSSTEGKENQYSLSSDGEERSLIPSPSTPKSQRSTRARKQPDYKAIASGNVYTPAQPRSSRSGGSPRGLGNGANSPRSMSPRTRSTENMSSSPVVKLEKLEVGRTTRSRREIASKLYGKDNDIERAPPSAIVFEDQKGKTGADESKSVSKENIYEFVDNEHEQIIETSLRSARSRKKRVSDQEFPLQQQQQPLPDYMPASPVSASNSTSFGQESRHGFEIHAPEVRSAEENPKLPHLSNVDAVIEAVSKGNFGSFEDDPTPEVSAVPVPPAPAVVVSEPVTDHLPAPPPTRSTRRSTETKKEVDQKAEKTFIIAEPPRFEGREAGRKGPTVPPLRIKVAHGAKVEKSEEKHYVIERAKGPGSTTESEKPPLSFTVKLSDTGTAIIKSASGTTTPSLASPQLPVSGGKNQLTAGGDVFKTDTQPKKDSSIGLFSGLPQNEHHGSELDTKSSIAVSQTPARKSADALVDEATVSRPTGALHPKVAAKVQASQESQISIVQTQASVPQSIQQHPPSSTASISGLPKSSPVTPATPHGLKHTWSSSLQQDSHHQHVMPEQASSGPYLPAAYHQNLAQMSSPLPREAQILHQQPQQLQPPGTHPESKQPPNAHSQPIVRPERSGKASKPGGMEMAPDLSSKLAAEAPKHQQGPFSFPPHLPPAHSGQRPFIMPSDQPGHHAPHFPSGSLLKSGSDNRPAKSPSIQSQVASKIGAEVRTQTPPVTPGAMLYAGVVSGQPHSLSPSAASPEGQVIERIQNPIRQTESGQSQSPLGLHLPGSHHQDPVNRFMKDEAQDGSGALSGLTERTPSREIAMYMIEQQRLQQHLLIAEAARNSDPARNIAVAMRNALESSRSTPVALEGGRKGSLPTSQAVGHGQPLNLTPQSDLRGGQPDPSRVTPKSTPPAPQSPFPMQYYDRKGETGRLPATVAGSFMQPSPGGHREGLAPHIYQELSLANLPHSSYMVGRLPIDPRIYAPGQQAPPHLMREGVLPGSFPQAFPPGSRFPGLEHHEGKKNDSGHPDQPGPHMLRSPSPIQRQMQADALRQQLTCMPCDLPTRDSPVGFLQRYPVMWQGALALKNDNSYVQMHFIAGNRRLPNQALPQPMQNGALPPLRISQRMRLEHAQLEGVAKRMQCEDHYCILIAVACGRDQMDINQQTRALNEGFITYLLSKQAAGIVNVPLPGSEQVRFVVHIFPPCEFVDNSVAQQGGVILMKQLQEVPHAVVIIATT